MKITPLRLFINELLMLLHLYALNKMKKKIYLIIFSCCQMRMYVIDVIAILPKKQHFWFINFFIVDVERLLCDRNDDDDDDEMHTE